MKIERMRGQKIWSKTTGAFSLRKPASLTGLGTPPACVSVKSEAAGTRLSASLARLQGDSDAPAWLRALL